MPSTAGETFYDLALRALDEQQSEVAGLRTRAGTILAAAAIVATLLARPVFADAAFASPLHRLAAAAAVVGLVVVLTSAVELLRTHELGFTVDVWGTYLATRGPGDLEDLQFALAWTLDDLRTANAAVIRRLQITSGCALGGLVLETSGLAVVATLGFGP